MTIQLPDPATEDCRALSSVLARVGDWTISARVSYLAGTAVCNATVVSEPDLRPGGA
jgi:hypothetical protein